jgi:hypothetical protein
MFQSNKIHNNVLHNNFVSNYNFDVENSIAIENTNYSFQFLGNTTQDLKGERNLAYNNYYVSESICISEWNLYGSSRLGARNIDKVADVVFLASRNYNWINNTVTNEYIAPTASFTYKKYRVLGAKTFELTNHLGNVITTISDRKLMVEDAQNLGFVHHYKAEILSIGEQYAFGMSMPGRTFSVEKYRYGMNTQEKDDDIFEGAFTAEYWEYDSRVGRRWNNDPVFKNWESPYACFSNNPIYFVDILGLDPTKPISKPEPGDRNGLRVYNEDGTWHYDERDPIVESGSVDLPAMPAPPTTHEGGTNKTPTKPSTGSMSGKESEIVQSRKFQMEYQAGLRVGEFNKFTGYIKGAGTTHSSSHIEETIILGKVLGPIVERTAAIVGKAFAAFIGKYVSKSISNGFRITKHGELTNGIYTVSKDGMKNHVYDLGNGRSVFYHTVNADELVLKAAQYADEANLWIGNKAKVKILNTHIGRLSDGNPTDVVNIYRNSNGFIHGTPGN